MCASCAAQYIGPTMTRRRASTQPLTVPPAEQMLQLVSGYWVSQLLYVIAELGIADLLARAPQTAAQLATQTKTHGPYLRRILRALAGVGVLRLDKRGRFRLTRLGKTLRTDVADSQRDFVRMIVDDYNWQAWGHLLQGVRSGKVPFDEVHGKPVFPYLQEHPEQERVFAASMAAISRMENAAVASAYDFGKLRSLIDVGGSQGHLLGAILTRHPRLHGVLFDQPQVVAGARGAGYLSTPRVAGRCTIAEGSFFDAVPQGADGYILKYIIHDWDDARSLTILRNIRRAMAADGRVLLIEHVISDDNTPELGKLLDINMLVVPGGAERTRGEFAHLLAKAGLRLRRILPTKSRLSIVEAVAA